MKPPADRKEAFVTAYLLNGFNAKDAAVQAGYSPKTAAAQGSRLLNNVNVQRLITARTQPVLDRFGVTVENTLRHLAAIAYSDQRDVGTWGTRDGVPYFRPRNSEDLSEEAAMSIASTKMKAKFRPARYSAEGLLIEEEHWDVEAAVKQHDKLGALNTLAKYQGILPTSGKVRINVDQRHQEMNILDLAGFTKEEILELARMPLPEDAL